MLFNCLAVGCGGFIGSVLRYLLTTFKIGNATFPYITLGINFLGCFAILFFSGLLADPPRADERTALFLQVGLCGGFTTFSTFSSETLGMLESRDVLAACLHAIASCVLCVAGTFLGGMLARTIA